MKLGAQLYSVRTHLKNEEDSRAAFARLAKTGYENVQLSGAAELTAEIWRDISEESGLPIVVTHSSFKRIVEDTDALIAEHKTMNCPMIGLSNMPKEYTGTREALEAFFKVMEEPVKKIREAGLNFSYHNHNFEFVIPEGSDKPLYDVMLESQPDWQFILDTYWVEFAGYNAIEYLRKVGGKRLVNVHYKDMAHDEERSICACGQGRLDFKAITDVCLELGVVNVLVEQDNAVKFDPFEQMQSSFDHLRPIIPREI